MGVDVEEVMVVEYSGWWWEVILMVDVVEKMKAMLMGRW